MIKIINNSGLINAGRLCFAVSALLVMSCAPKQPEAPVRPDPVITHEKPFGPTVSMQELLDQTYSRQYSPLDSVFDISGSIYHHNLILITHEKPVLTLERGVTAYAAHDKFLAAGYADGNIRIWSDYPCPMLALPGREPVRGLWQDADYPYLSAAGDNDPTRVSIYDLNRCARVADIQTEAVVVNTSVSATGSYLALVDEGGRLWTGSLRGNLEQQATLRFAPLNMLFSPREGVLMLVDEAGWLLIWTTPDFSLLEQNLIPGGPFEKAVFVGPELILHGKKEDSKAVAWNIPESKIIESGHKYGTFELENEVLYYTSDNRQYVKKVHLGGPVFRVMADHDEMVFRVLDLDGEIRHYDAVTGFETQGGFSANQAEPVKVPLSGNFTWAGVDYTLADPVVTSEQWVLWSRHIPERGYFLWWSPNTGLNSMDFKGRLPVRDNIRVEIPPAWVDLK